MKKIVGHLLILLSLFAILFTISSANAMSARSFDTSRGRQDQQDLAEKLLSNNANQGEIDALITDASLLTEIPQENVQKIVNAMVSVLQVMPPEVRFFSMFAWNNHYSFSMFLSIVKQIHTITISYQRSGQTMIRLSDDGTRISGYYATYPDKIVLTVYGTAYPAYVLAGTLSYLGYMDIHLNIIQRDALDTLQLETQLLLPGWWNALLTVRGIFQKGQYLKGKICVNVYDNLAVYMTNERSFKSNSFCCIAHDATLRFNFEGLVRKMRHTDKPLIASYVEENRMWIYEDNVVGPQPHPPAVIPEGVENVDPQHNFSGSKRLRLTEEGGQQQQVVVAFVPASSLLQQSGAAEEGCCGTKRKR